MNADVRRNMVNTMPGI